VSPFPVKVDLLVITIHRKAYIPEVFRNEGLDLIISLDDKPERWKLTGTCSEMCYDKTNSSVMNEPYETTSLFSRNWASRVCSVRVCMRVNAAPILRSSNMRASTAWA
jgi:hypothetical protein